MPKTLSTILGVLVDDLVQATRIESKMLRSLGTNFDILVMILQPSKGCHGADQDARCLLSIQTSVSCLEMLIDASVIDIELSECIMYPHE